VRNHFELAHQNRHLWSQAYAESHDVLTALKHAGLRLAVISNTEDGRLEESLGSAQLTSHFELLMDSHLVGCRKPDAEIFRLTLNRLQIQPHEAVYVGDSYSYDVVGAQQAGLHSVLIDRTDRYQTIDCARIGTLRELIGTHASGVL
jgi:putative hydrolase of the HAD superfamily